MRTSAETHTPAAPQPPPPAVTRVWLAVLGPPAAWVFDLLLRYFLVRHANASESVGLLHAVTALSLVIIGAAVALGARERARLRSMPGADDESRLLAALRRMVLWSYALAAFFALLVLAQAFPSLVLEPTALT